MRKLVRDRIAIAATTYLLFFLGWGLFGAWAGFAMACSYLVGLLSVLILSEF